MTIVHCGIGVASMGATEVLVPKAFEWWTFLALATNPEHRFDELSFVPKIGSQSRTVVIDCHFLKEHMKFLRGKGRILVIFWDGCQSYLDNYSQLLDLAEGSARPELLFVGDLPPTELRTDFDCRLLFSQDAGDYRPEWLFELAKIKSSRRFAKAGLKYRSLLISAKVLLQLLIYHRIKEYNGTNFVYCGDSGLAKLAGFCDGYGLSVAEFPRTLRDVFDETAFASQWLMAVRHLPGLWSNRFIMRSLLRFLALKALVDSNEKSIFLNIYPDPNINVYQAGLLFREHTFLDFGGAHGDERIYPRSADLLFLNRRSIRFDIRQPMEEWLDSNEMGPADVLPYIVRFREQILLQFSYAVHSLK